MERLRSTGHLKILQERLVRQLDPTIPTLVIPAGTCGQASGAGELVRAAEDVIRQRGLHGRLRLRVTGCHGYCQAEPSALIEPQRIFYPRVDARAVSRIIEASVHGQVLDEMLFVDPTSGRPLTTQDELPFFRTQVRTILARNEKVDPLRIDTYLASGGYSALLKVLERGGPQWVVDEIKASGLRGRGGAGFPTGLKWELLASQPDGRGKFVVCNADEGDPGAYMDRSVLEGNPHSIIEGMLIGAYGTGADEGVIYVRNEYPLAITHLQIALEQARELGLLGDDILGTGFRFHLSLVQGAGAFVCGEETALIRAIEGKMGEPRQRPPFPIQKGIDGKPTVINNVETWANVPVIVEQGAAAFAKVGTRSSTGTKIFSLVGKITNTGLVEVPLGMPIAGIIDEIGGGRVGNARIKAVQTGGPSGGCIPHSRFNLAIDYDSLTQAGSIMGSGGMIVMDDNTCMVDVAKYFMHFLTDECCGKCFTCRKGTQRMYEILDDISAGRGTRQQLDLLEELAEVVRDTTLCGLGQTAANPVLSTLRYFRDEYLAHIEQQRCPAGVCKELITYAIGENCQGCQACQRVCPSGAIEGEKKARHHIDLEKCVKCDACRSICKWDAVIVT